ncbi:MAG: IgGFc-binding protein, partial [Myxococcales bacterium]|nr:IgGFc-binding protein [Myxococcales bacterium]
MSPRSTTICCALVALSACRGGGATEVGYATGEGDGSGESSADEIGSSGESTSESSSDSGESSDTEQTKFDLAPNDLPPPPPMIPETCEQAEAGETSVGCLFYTVDLDSNVDFTPFAAVVANVQSEGQASVTLERKLDGVWTVLEGPVAIDALDLHTFTVADDFHLENSGINPGGAYRISADLPVIAYQFNPIDGQKSYLSDASLLYPVSSWDHHNQIVNYADASEMANPFITIAAAHDGTAITVTPAVATAGGPGVPAAAAGESVQILLDAGDSAVVEPVDTHADLSGTRVDSDPQTPVAVFAGHGCANIPAEACCCDHLEEQLTGVRLWGKEFVAGHMPPRDFADPEATYWQIYAS